MRRMSHNTSLVVDRGPLTAAGILSSYVPIIDLTMGPAFRPLAGLSSQRLATCLRKLYQNLVL